MAKSKVPCTYLKIFSDAQEEDENLKVLPTQHAVWSYVHPLQQNTLQYTLSRIIAEEDGFGDDEASDGDDFDDDEFWDCEPEIKHPSLRVSSHTESADRFAILACLDVNSRRNFKDEVAYEDYASNFTDSDSTVYTAAEDVEPPSCQDPGTETTHDISSDDDSLFAQYGAILPSDTLPEKYQRHFLHLLKCSASPPSNTRASIPRGCYRIVDFLHENDFSEVVIAQSMTRKKKGPGLKKGRLFCIKVYRNDWPLSMPEDGRAELQAEKKAYKRLSEAMRSKRPGFQFLMQLQALIQEETRTFFLMDVMDYPLRVVIQDEPWAVNRVQDTKRLVAQMALGLAALHSVGIIHRDLKPENVLLDYRGNVRIADFGASKVSNQCVAYLPGGSYAHAYAGTWPYIAPEVLVNKTNNKPLPYGIEADYWSLGCIVFELEAVFGDFMFEDRTQFDLWCSLKDDADKQSFLEFGGISSRAFSLVCGLVQSDVLKRFGLYEIIHHPYFGKAENSEFYYAQERAMRRTPESNEEIEVSALCMDDRDHEIKYIYI